MYLIPVILALALPPSCQPWEVWRFPLPLASGQYDAAREYVEWLDSVRESDSYFRERSCGLYDEALKLKGAWKQLLQCHYCVMWGNSDPRLVEELTSLRFLLGEEAYASGRMPPCVPLSYFGRVP